MHIHRSRFDKSPSRSSHRCTKIFGTIRLPPHLRRRLVPGSTCCLKGYLLRFRILNRYAVVVVTTFAYMQEHFDSYMYFEHLVASTTCLSDNVFLTRSSFDPAYRVRTFEIEHCETHYHHLVLVEPAEPLRSCVQ
ncbi:hypothetical protein D6C95_07471 [Aureobasidium pullulans]|nr:hypothetical protein D6C95_07471 [Aureobasidium pullulans]